MAGVVHISRYCFLGLLVIMDRKKSGASAKFLGPISAKTAIKFFCIFVLVYGLLMTLWPVLGTTYSKFFRAGAAFLFESFGSKGTVSFEPLSDSHYDIRAVFYNRDLVGPNSKPLAGRGRLSSFCVGYIYVVFIAALVLATPISLRRKAWALFWAMILIHVFLALRLAIWLLYHFTNEPLCLFVLSPFCKRLLFVVVRGLNPSITFGLIVSTFIWILVSFRREDWSRILIHAPKVPAHKNMPRQ